MPLFNTVVGNSAFETADEEEEKQVSLVLQSIVVKSGKRFAVINGQVLTEGNSIEGYQVKKIAGYNVELEGAEEELLLTLHKVDIKN